MAVAPNRPKPPKVPRQARKKTNRPGKNLDLQPTRLPRETSKTIAKKLPQAVVFKMGCGLSTSRGSDTKEYAALTRTLL